MKTSELRLGNFVMYNENIVCVDKIYGENVGYNLLNEDSVGIAYIECISPVILTEELLLKLGATKYMDFNNQIYYEFEGKELAVYVLYKDNIYFHAYEYDGMMYETIPCTGLHSLQNKYYALNGVEMEIKL